MNPKASAINAIRAYPTVGAVPDQIDMAVIVVPRDHVLPVVQECADHGVKGVVVISAGFKEIGGDGIAREAELLDVVRRGGMRLVGPNCMGVLNADPAFSMNATFAPIMPPFGRVGFVSQSGAMGLSVLDYAREYGIGISQFVSMGNKPDVSGNVVLLGTGIIFRLDFAPRHGSPTVKIPCRGPYLPLIKHARVGAQLGPFV